MADPKPKKLSAAQRKEIEEIIDDKLRSWVAGWRPEPPIPEQESRR